MKRKQVLTGKQRNWLFMMLKSLHKSKFDRTYTNNERLMINSLMRDLGLYYNSDDDCFTGVDD